MGKLFVDPLAIAALVGFASLMLVCAILVGWVMAKARTPSRPVIAQESGEAPADTPAF